MGMVGISFGHIAKNKNTVFLETSIMEKVVSFKSDSHNTLHLGAPPIPREHGAWVILYAPLLIGLAAAWPPPALPARALAASSPETPSRATLDDVRPSRSMLKELT